MYSRRLKMLERSEYGLRLEILEKWLTSLGSCDMAETVNLQVYVNLGKTFKILNELVNH